MTATWALVFIICTGRYDCAPNYVEIYNSRKECKAASAKQEGKHTSYALCAPISKD